MSLQTNDITVDRAFYIRELQGYLQAIEVSLTGAANVPVDGVYGTETTRAVQEFQQRAGLPVTGEVDRATWDAIREAYLKTVYENALPTPIQAYRDPAQFLQTGDQGDGVAFLQIMLRRLSLRYPNLPPIRTVSGIYTPETERAVRAFQRLVGLPETGLTDKATWDAVTRLYNDGGAV
ncbi:MAG: peptidoglycan-binding protein [Clostridia bacterium]|nr:peptidoglycan-binding protein [Clostridia bacterium]